MSVEIARLSARDIPSRAWTIGLAARRAVPLECPPGIDASAHAGDFIGTGNHAAGLRIRSGGAETFLARLAALELSASMTTTLAPLRSLIEIIDDELVNADDQFQALVAIASTQTAGRTTELSARPRRGVDDVISPTHTVTAPTTCM